MRSRKRNTILRVEPLEDRCTPTTWGNPWPDAAHLKLSFVPDGTLVGNHASNLFATMNAVAPTSVWQNEVLRAFQTWAAQAKIDFAIVTDNGQPLGTTGNIQGDDRFGDIRIAAYPMAPGALAEATPFQVDAGTWAGDVHFNSTALFSVDGNSGVDLFSIALHEAGHVLGFDESTEPASVMYADYAGVRTGLGASDITNVQGLYGVRTNPNGGNCSFATAVALNPTSNGNGTLFASTTGTLATWYDHNVYSFVSQPSYGEVKITLATVGMSLLTPQVTVYDAAGNVVIAAMDTESHHGGFVILLTNVTPQNTYYIEVKSAEANAFGVGAYQLRVREQPVPVNGPFSATVSHGVTASTGLLDPFHMNTTFATATPLTGFHSSFNSPTYDTARGSLNDGNDVAYYTLQAPASSNGTNTVALSAMVWGLQNQLKYRVQVFDSQQNPVPAQIIVNDGFTFAVQVANATPGATYYVKVTQKPNSQGAGNYFVGVHVGPNALVMQHHVSGTMNTQRPVLLKTFDTTGADHGNLFHFILSGQADTSANAHLKLTDALGQIVFMLTADSAEATTGNVLLAPGVYFATFFASVASGPLPALGFGLLGDILTAPIGPEGTDPSGTPGGSSGSGGTPPPTWNEGSTGVGSNPPASGPFSPPSAVVTLQNPTDQANLAGDAVQVVLTASDSAGNALTFTVSGLPEGLSIDAATGVISGTIANDAAYSIPYVVTITATDAIAGSNATQSFYWYISLPIVTLNNIENQSARAGDNVTLDAWGWCTDGYPLTFTAEGLPPGLSMDPATGVISGHIANNAATGTPYIITITATDASSGASASITFEWTVNPPEMSAINPGDQTSNRGDSIYLAISASCSDGAALTFSVTNLPPGLTIDAETGIITGTILEDAEPGTYSVTIDILDPTSGVSMTLTFTWTVNGSE